MQAALVALVLLLGGVISGIHQATTTHIRCAEHGELVHVASVARSLHPDREPVARGLAMAASDDEHCTLTSPLRAASAAVRAPQLSAWGVGDAVPCVEPPRVTARVAALYRTAPKTSPPA